MATILIVENNKNQLLLYEQEFRLEGHEILTAIDGIECLAIAQRQPLDLIIMDINLPKMDGIETMGRILSQHKNIPIIINTSYSQYKDNLMLWAADAYIIKSSDLSILKNKVKEILAIKTVK